MFGIKRNKVYIIFFFFGILQVKPVLVEQIDIPNHNNGIGFLFS